MDNNCTGYLTFSLLNAWTYYRIQVRLNGVGSSTEVRNVTSMRHVSCLAQNRAEVPVHGGYWSVSHQRLTDNIHEQIKGRICYAAYLFCTAQFFGTANPQVHTLQCRKDWAHCCVNKNSHVNETAEINCGETSLSVASIENVVYHTIKSMEILLGLRQVSVSLKRDTER